MRRRAALVRAGALACALLAGAAARAETTVYLPGLGLGPGAFAAIAREAGGPSFNEAMPATIPGQEDGHLTPEEVARDLHRRLAARGDSPPYVIVAHSLGGGYALAFAALYPAETRALILVDPRLPGFTGACEAAGLPACAVPPAFYAKLSAGQRAQLDGYDDAPTPPAALGPIPVVIYGATLPPRGLDAGWQRFWLDGQARYAAALQAGTMIPVAQGGHGLHKQFPALIVTAIRDAWR